MCAKKVLPKVTLTTIIGRNGGKYTVKRTDDGVRITKLLTKPNGTEIYSNFKKYQYGEFEAYVKQPFGDSELTKSIFYAAHDRFSPLSDTFNRRWSSEPRKVILTSVVCKNKEYKHFDWFKAFYREESPFANNGYGGVEYYEDEYGKTYGYFSTSSYGLTYQSRLKERYYEILNKIFKK